jgi:hypothetical protein
MGDRTRGRGSHGLNVTFVSLSYGMQLKIYVNLSLLKHHGDFPKICTLFKLLWQRMDILLKQLTSATFYYLKQIWQWLMNTGCYFTQQYAESNTEVLNLHKIS